MFRFKQFTIRQDRCPMKVGTDGVLVGAWVRLQPSDRRILDIGTGTGVITLILAQRAAEAAVTGIDVDEVSQACENATASPWGGRVEFRQCAVQEFSSETAYDLIVSNPPYFVDSLTCPDQGRTTARHAVRLTFEDLRDAVVRLLAPEGRFAVILPTVEAAVFAELCRGRLSLVRRTEVRTTPHHAPKRVLMEFAQGGVQGEPELSEIVIGTGEHERYTPEYMALTGDFYLKF